MSVPPVELNTKLGLHCGYIVLANMGMGSGVISVGVISTPLVKDCDMCKSVSLVTVNNMSG